MAKIYAKLVLKGEMQLEDVPERWREEVEKLIEGA